VQHESLHRQSHHQILLLKCLYGIGIETKVVELHCCMILVVHKWMMMVLHIVEVVNEMVVVCFDFDLKLILTLSG